MALPSYIAKSATPFEGTTGGSPSLPVGTAAGDFLLLVTESVATEDVAVPAGYTALSDANSGGTGTRCEAFWKIAGAGETAPTVADPGNHLYAVVFTYRGTDLTNPIHQLGATAFAVASTAVSLPGFTTTVNDCLVVAACTGGADANTARFSAQANASLASITERHDLGTALGSGGGLSVWDGTKAVAGTVNASTATIVSQDWAGFQFALQPPAAVTTKFVTWI
jgi:hypothetical protein